MIEQRHFRKGCLRAVDVSGRTSFRDSKCPFLSITRVAERFVRVPMLEKHVFSAEDLPEKQNADSEREREMHPSSGLFE